MQILRSGNGTDQTMRGWVGPVILGSMAMNNDMCDVSHTAGGVPFYVEIIQ